MRKKLAAPTWIGADSVETNNLDKSFYLKKKVSEFRSPFFFPKISPQTSVNPCLRFLAKSSKEKVPHLPKTSVLTKPTCCTGGIVSLCLWSEYVAVVFGGTTA
jgi:hypothetical protein